jgi:heptosyltransferase-2/heptosyltransferase-3
LRKPGRLPRQPRAILVIRPDHLGDLVLAAPAVAALRQAYPAARIAAWLGPWGEPVWRDHPALDTIETCPFPGFTRAAKPNPVQPYGLALREARRLRGRFDLAVNLRFDFWWGAMAACWAGIPTIGYDVPECRPFLSRAAAYRPGLHEAEQSLRLVEALTDRPAPDAPVDLFPDAGLPEGLPDGAIAIHPGAGAEVKLWTEDRWAAVGSELGAQAPIALTAGSPEELAMAERIAARMSSPGSVVHGLSLRQLAAFYRRCSLVIGPDNGPLHVARAVATPTVALFGPTNPAQFGPRHNPTEHEVLRLPWRCIPCRRLDYTQAELDIHLCVKLIEPEQVLAAARRVLASRQVRSS